MTKKIDPSLKKKPGPKGKATDAQTYAAWRDALRAVIATASPNMGVVRSKTFYTMKELRSEFGNVAVNEFKNWFVSSRLFDQQVADVIEHKLRSGKIDKETYDHLIVTKAFSWVWALHPSRAKAAWSIARGYTTLDEVEKTLQEIDDGE